MSWLLSVSILGVRCTRLFELSFVDEANADHSTVNPQPADQT